jgi:hypothetical protein
MKRTLPILLALILIPGLVQGASQISPRDGLWLSLPPDSVKCVVLRLPQDAGLSTAGNYIFSVGCTPSPSETWADLSEQIVREVHENNTVLIPICFDTAGSKPIGNCSVPYTITLSESYTGTTKSWRGGICVSEHADADIIDPGEDPDSGDDVRDILNDNTDLVAAWFESEMLYAKPGQEAVLNLSVQSYAELIVVVTMESTLGISPGQARLSTGQEDPLHHQTFTIAAPQEPGEYKLTARVVPEGCNDQSYCTKVVKGILIVTDDNPPEETGFEVKLTPENIDIKEPGEVIMTLSIVNNDDTRLFESSIAIDPIDGESGFKGESVEIGSYDSHSRVFIFTPGSSSRLYEVTARVEADGFTSSATSFISIDELATDAARQAEGLGTQAQAELGSWLDDHEDSTYGSDLQEYGDLREKLAQAAASKPSTAPHENTTAPPEPPVIQESPLDLTWVILPAILAAVALVVAFLFLRKRGSGGEEESGDVEYY